MICSFAKNTTNAKPVLSNNWMHGLKRKKYPSLTERITRARGRLHHGDGVTQIAIETDAVSGLEQPAQMGICDERARQETNKKM